MAKRIVRQNRYPVDYIALAAKVLRYSLRTATREQHGEITTRALVLMRQAQAAGTFIDPHASPKIPRPERWLTECHRGHVFNADNVYLDGKGYRRCRQCQLDRGVARNLQKREQRLEKRTPSPASPDRRSACNERSREYWLAKEIA